MKHYTINTINTININAIGSDFDIHSQAPPYVHIVGGEVVFWLFGRVYKFDGMGSKVTRGLPTLMWGCDDTVIIG